MTVGDTKRNEYLTLLFDRLMADAPDEEIPDREAYDLAVEVYDCIHSSIGTTDPYVYNVSEIRIVDGDTIRCKVHTGFTHSFYDTFRLYGINTPETRGAERKEGLFASQAAHWCLEGGFSLKLTKKIKDKTTDAEIEQVYERIRKMPKGLVDEPSHRIRTIKDGKGKYGRYLAEVWYRDHADRWHNLNALLLEHGFAVPYMK